MERPCCKFCSRSFYPLSAPGIASVAIFAFIMSWTEYMFASILVNSEASRTLPVGLAGIIGQYQIDWGLLLAGATLNHAACHHPFQFCRAPFCRRPDKRGGESHETIKNMYSDWMPGSV
jgi:hypothetical protein